MLTWREKKKRNNEIKRDDTEGGTTTKKDGHREQRSRGEATGGRNKARLKRKYQ